MASFYCTSLQRTPCIRTCLQVRHFSKTLQSAQAPLDDRTSKIEQPKYVQPAKLADKSDQPPPSSSDRTPRPLTHPLGVAWPPQAGENTGRDDRSMRQRRDDFVNYDKHIEKRARMTSQIARSYFKDFNDMKYFKGKSFIAPARVFRADQSLYFPNLQGNVLTGKIGDTTDVLKGRVSVVGVFSSDWAGKQLQTFCGAEQHAELQALLDVGREPGNSQESAQYVEINNEPNALKYWILRLFSYRLRAQRPEHRWSSYFIVRRGFADHLRAALGIFNQRVGHVYLLDANCKVRWAGNANAEAGEKSGMVSGLRRLLQEAHGTPSDVASEPDRGNGSRSSPDSPMTSVAESSICTLSSRKP